jgi:hypothetical protein
MSGWGVPQVGDIFACISPKTMKGAVGLRPLTANPPRPRPAQESKAASEPACNDAVMRGSPGCRYSCVVRFWVVCPCCVDEPRHGSVELMGLLAREAEFGQHGPGHGQGLVAQRSSRAACRSRCLGTGSLWLPRWRSAASRPTEDAGHGLSPAPEAGRSAWRAADRLESSHPVMSTTMAAGAHGRNERPGTRT